MINLDPECFQYYRNDREEGPFFAIEARLRACDSFVFRLPIRETEADAIIAGIAGFAIRPIVSELLPTPEPYHSSYSYSYSHPYSYPYSYPHPYCYP